MNIQENLIRFRKERNMSQEALADKLGVSRQAVSKWETGDASPDLYNLTALADALDVSLDALCGRVRPSEIPDPVPPRKKRVLWPWITCFVLVVLIPLCLYMYQQPIPGGFTPSSGLPETVYLNHFGFGNQIYPTDQGSLVTFDCEPNVFVSDLLRYTITFQPETEGAEVLTPDFTYDDGYIWGTVILEENVRYTVTGTVKYLDESREFPIAADLMVTDGKLSYKSDAQ